MPNTFIDLEVIGKKMLPRLLENLLLPSLCYKDYSNEYVNGLGTKIQVKKPIKFTANEFTQGGSVSAQDINEESVTVELNKMADVTVEVSSLEMAMKMGDQKLNNVIEGMAVALAQKINADGLKMAYKAGKIVAGGDYGLKYFSDIRKDLNKEKAPLDGRFAIWSTDADAEFTQIATLNKVNDSGSPKCLREGEIGRVFGLDNYMSQAVAEGVAHDVTSEGTKTFTVSDDKKTVTVTYGTSCTATSFVKGDIIKFTGSNNAVCYCGIESATVTSASKKIVFVLSNECDITPTDFTGQAGALNFAMQKDALAFVTRPLVAPHGADATTVSYNGIGIRLVRDYNITTKKETISADILYNFEMVQPECAVTVVK